MKKFLIWLGAVIVVLIVAALVAPFLIPTDTYAARLAALVKQSTGRELKITGPVRLSFLPQLALEANGVALANAPGAHDPDMLRLKKLDVQVHLLPLLHGAVELGRFVLTEPQISLEVDKTGKPNWVFASAAPGGAATKPQAAPAASASSGAGTLSELRLQDVRLVSGKIGYRDDRTGQSEALDDINMRLSLPDLDSPFAGEGSAVWHAQKVSLSIGIAKPRALLGGAESGFSIHLQAAPVDLGFAGAMTGLPPAKLGGKIDLSVPSIRGLAQWAGAPMPAGPGLQHLAIKGRIDMAGPKFSFSDAAIAIDAIAAKGSLAVDTGGARPALKGTLAVDKLDLNPYLPPETASSLEKPAASAPQGGLAPGARSAAAGWSDAPIDLAGLGLADGDFDLKAGSILYRKIVIGESALDVHLKERRLTANLTRLTLYKGTGKGKISVDGSGAVPAIAMNFALSGVEVEPLLVAAAGTDRLTGTGKLDFDVAAKGKSQRALVAALAGKGAFNLADGQIKGVNLIALAESATRPLTGLSGDNATAFGSLTGTYTITSGIVRNDDLQITSGVIPITGAGTVDLPNRSVNYRVLVSLAGAIGVPVLVSGPWDNLSYRPDLAGVLRGAVQAPGELIDKLRSLGAGAGAGGANAIDRLKGLFGK
jgi:AsmA protein